MRLLSAITLAILMIGCVPDPAEQPPLEDSVEEEDLFLTPTPGANTEEIDCTNTVFDGMWFPYAEDVVSYSLVEWEPLDESFAVEEFNDAFVEFRNPLTFVPQNENQKPEDVIFLDYVATATVEERQYTVSTDGLMSNYVDELQTCNEGSLRIFVEPPKPDLPYYLDGEFTDTPTLYAEEDEQLPTGTPTYIRGTIRIKWGGKYGAILQVLLEIA